MTAARTAQERIGKLNQNARTVALQWIGTGGAAVSQVFEDLQRLADDRVAFLSFDMGDKAESACVMLVGRVIQALPCRGQMLGRR